MAIALEDAASAAHAPALPAACGSPWLSVLIPFHNVVDYLGECVQSVLGQALDGVEIVLVDDASSDGSRGVADALAAQADGRLRILTHALNQGVSAARNSLLEACLGRYAWFLDSDDLMMPGAIAELRACIERHDPDLVLCDFRTVRSPMSLKHRLRGELHRRTFAGTANQASDDVCALVRGLFTQGMLHLWSKIARRALWADDLRFPVGRYFEDLLIAPQLALRAKRHIYVPRVWIGYRQRAGSILSSPHPGKVDDMMDALAGFPRPAPPHSASTAHLSACFAVAAHAARTFTIACRIACRHGNEARLPAYYSQLLACLPMPLPELMSAYLRRGWFWRALRLRHWQKRVRAENARLQAHPQRT
jgi:hypothetical protein